MATEKQSPQKHDTHVQNIHTEGGTAVTGDIKIENGDFIGRDKNIFVSPIEISRFSFICLISVPFLVIVLIVLLITNLIPRKKDLLVSGPMQYSIAIAQIGQQDAKGNIRSTRNGKELSEILGTKLQEEFDRTSTDQAFKVQLRYDTVASSTGSQSIGLVANKSQAERLLKKLNVNLLIYGYLSDGKPQMLQLSFAFKVKSLEIEPDATIGYQRLGLPVRFDHPDLVQEEFEHNQALLWRLEALIELTRGLGHDQVGNHAKALEIFLRAAQKIKAWHDYEGKEVLYYFQGREALALLKSTEGPFALSTNNQSLTLLLGQEAQAAIQSKQATPLQLLSLAESAFLEAIRIDPDYVTAFIGLGHVYFQRGQFELLTQQPISATVAACTSQPSFSQIQNSEQLTATLPGAIGDLDQAIGFYKYAADHAIHMTEISRMSEISAAQVIPIAQVMRGYSYALKGMAYLGENAQKSENEELEQAKVELNQSIEHMTLTLQPFRDNQQVDFLAFAYYGLGEAYHSLGHVYVQQQNPVAAKERFQHAHEDYKRCYAPATMPNPADMTDVQRAIDCSCRARDEHVINKDLTTLGGGNG